MLFNWAKITSFISSRQLQHALFGKNSKSNSNIRIRTSTHGIKYPNRDDTSASCSVYCSLINHKSLSNNLHMVKSVPRWNPLAREERCKMPWQPTKQDIFKGWLHDLYCSLLPLLTLANNSRSIGIMPHAVIRSRAWPRAITIATVFCIAGRCRSHWNSYICRLMVVPVVVRSLQKKQYPNISGVKLIIISKLIIDVTSSLTTRTYRSVKHQVNMHNTSWRANT